MWIHCYYKTFIDICHMAQPYACSCQPTIPLVVVLSRPPSSRGIRPPLIHTGTCHCLAAEPSEWLATSPATNRVPCAWLFLTRPKFYTRFWEALKMAYRHVKLARELSKEKESDITWKKVYDMFDDMLADFCTRDTILSDFSVFHDLLIRSIQSDRSRLNGISLELLIKIVAAAERSVCFNRYIPVLIKLTGRANKIFVTRATDALMTLIEHVDAKCLMKNASDNIDNPNKNVRYAIYKMIIHRAASFGSLFSSYIQRGVKDPAVEVRALCRDSIGSSVVCAVKREQVAVEKRIETKTYTPRKNIRLEKQEEERIKLLEREVLTITSNATVKANTQLSFHEKLFKLKKDHSSRQGAKSAVTDNTDDDLTPKRLDRYLNKYRSTVRDSQVPSKEAVQPTYGRQTSNLSDIRSIIDNYKKAFTENSQTRAVADAPLMSRMESTCTQQDAEPAGQGGAESVELLEFENIRCEMRQQQRSSDAVTCSPPKPISEPISHVLPKIQERLAEATAEISERIELIEEIEHVQHNIESTLPQPLTSPAKPPVFQVPISIHYDNSFEPLDTHVSFAGETLLFSDEARTVLHRGDMSLVHELLSENLLNEEIASDKHSSMLGDISLESRLITVDASDNSSASQLPDEREMSKSLANISIGGSPFESPAVPVPNIVSRQSIDFIIEQDNQPTKQSGPEAFENDTISIINLIDSSVFANTQAFSELSVVATEPANIPVSTGLLHAVATAPIRSEALIEMHVLEQRLPPHNASVYEPVFTASEDIDRTVVLYPAKQAEQITNEPVCLSQAAEQAAPASAGTAEATISRSQIALDTLPIHELFSGDLFHGDEQDSLSQDAIHNSLKPVFEIIDQIEEGQKLHEKTDYRMLQRSRPDDNISICEETVISIDDLT